MKSYESFWRAPARQTCSFVVSALLLFAASCASPIVGGECATGYEQCHHTCVDTQNDPNNCGGCGIMCASGLCSMGMCVDGDGGMNDMRVDGDMSVDPDGGDGGVDADMGPPLPSIIVSPVSGLRTSETGETVTFSIVLSAAPSSDVTIALSSSDSSEGEIAPSTVRFTSVNWPSPQLITITGVDDADADGTVSYTIITDAAMSADAAYDGMNPSDVSVENIDDETAGITVAPRTGLQTTESGGTDTFTIRLNTMPSANVTITFSSSDAGEVSVMPSMVEFTDLNWNSPQTLTVTGVDDPETDGNQEFTILVNPATSGDSNYMDLDGEDIAGTNLDNETAGVILDPMSVLTTTEAGGTAVITVVLQSPPTEEVSIPVVSTNEMEGTVSTSALVFTPDSWNMPQIVTVTGVNDFLIDGNHPYQVSFGPASSVDAQYDGLAPVSADLINIDDESSGITVTPMIGLITTEGGGSASFSVVLNSEPSSTVTIDLTSSNTLEGSVSPSELVFMPGSDWNMPQTVTITGVDDFLADGPQPYQIVVSVNASTVDPNYATLADVMVEATNIDDEMAGVTVSPTTGLMVAESGTTATFTIVLNSEPTGSVTIDLSSDQTGEATVDPMSVTFTAANWDEPQTITVTGVDDPFADGDRVVTIVTTDATSSDPDYNGVVVADVSVVNMDDDHVGVTVTPTTLTTSETGPAVTFTVVLTSQPSADVPITLHLTDTSRASVMPSSLLFDGSNWNVPQTVTVTPTDDMIANGDIVDTVVLDTIVSTGLYYNGVDPDDVAVTITDNETGSIVVTPTSGLTTSEAGGTAMFTIVLTSEPTAPVTVSLMSSNTAEGTVAPASVVFNAGNWSVAQNVIVTGVDDSAVDGDVSYSIITGAAMSSDAVYGGLAVADVTLVNTDDDVGGVLVMPTSGLTTTEAGGTAMFTVVLTAPPVADVVIPLSTSNPLEGDLMVASLTFTTSNWNMAQTVTVRGVDDSIQDGPQMYTIITGATASSSAGYDGLAVSDVSLTNTDNDVAGITVTPTSGLATSETGTSASFTIVLTSQPTNNVTINLSSSDSTEASVAPASVVFSSLNWNMPQSITVMGVDDFMVDGVQPFTIVTAAAMSSDSNYSGRDASDVSGTNSDNDVAGVTVSPTSGLVTTEIGGSTTFSIVLTSQPSSNVTITLMSSDVGEASVSPASVTFTGGDWNVAQVVTVTGVDDVIIDGNQMLTIVTSTGMSADSNYNGIAVADVSVTNNDNDSANVVVTPTSGLVVTETGTTASFTMVLAAMPTASVAISLASSDPTEGSVSVSSVVFTTMNWNVPQMVTITGIDDVLLDGDIAFSITTGNCVSSDVSYSGRTVADVSVTNQDNEGGGVTVNPTSGLFVTEAGSTASFTIVLTIAPSANVTIPLSSSNTAEASVSPNSVTFTVGNWNVPQNVTVTGAADGAIDGDQPVTIITGATSSSQALYNGLTVADVTATVIDVDRQRCVSCDALYLPRGGDVGGGVATSASTSGRYVAFMSAASNLVPADSNGAIDLFVRDRQTGAITRESVNSAGAQSVGCNAASGTPSITPDGRYVVFSCSATDLVGTDTNGNTDVFIRDRAIGATTLVSFRATNSNSCNGTSTNPTVTDDGRWVSFISSCTNATVSDTNGATTDLFARDTVSAVNYLISVDSSSMQLASATTNGSVAGGGNYFVFASAGAFAAGDTNGASDIYLRDFAMNTTTRVSLSSGGGDPTGGASITPTITRDGRYVVYASTATNIVAGDSNGVQDIFVRDLIGLTNTRVSVDSSGVQAGAISQSPSITSDGRYVAFQSSATNLVSSDTNGFDDVFVRDITGGTTTLVSRNAAGTQLNGAMPATSYPSIAPDGTFVVFASSATNMLTNDVNGVADVFAVPYL